MHTGSCLCGAVTYEIDDLPGPVVECHCRTCRKTHGSAFKVGSPVPKALFRWTGGDDVRRAFESSPGKQRWFCSTCGTHLASERAEGPVALAVATLDDESAVAAPSMHIWASDKAAWFDPDPSLTAHDAYPPAP